MTGADHITEIQMSRIEGVHLARLVTQFAELLAETGRSGSDAPADPAIARLVPDAYADDPEAAREFRSLTAGDLLSRRADDAGVVLASLSPETPPLDVASLTTPEQLEPLTLLLSADAARAWLRTLAALRLVLASRLGIENEDHDSDDPRFAIYEWLGYRLDGLVSAWEN